MNSWRASTVTGSSGARMSEAGGGETLRVFPDIETLSQKMAVELRAFAENAIAARGIFRLVLNGGGTPQSLFEILGEPPYRSAAFWEAVEIYWGDERCVLPESEGSSYRQASEAFLKDVPIPDGQIFRIPGELGPERAAAEYARLLAARSEGPHPWPRFDLVLLGLGMDGHTASLFPGQPTGGPADATLAVSAQYADRPAERVSLTPAVFNHAREIWWMVAGGEKAEIVRCVLAERDAPQKIPALLIRPYNGRMVWWLDEAAAADLPQDT